MTREEAVAVLKGLMKNPLFSEVHKVAFNIAIHDIKQRHEWDINNLILINKENYEPTEQEPIIDKIRTEIEQEIIPRNSDQYDHEAMWQNVGLRMALKVIDKYKG